MAYDKDKLEEQALKAIKQHKLTTAEEVISYLPCNDKTYYNHNLHKLQTIKEALNNNRVDIKKKLKKKWLNSENATLNIALFKLLATDEEREILNNNSLNVNLFQDKKFEIIEDDGDDTEHDKD